MDKRLSFFDHSDELRSRLIKCVVFVSVMAFGVGFFIDPILAEIIKPVGYIVFTSPADAFVARLQLIILGAVLCSFPFIFYQVWAFVSAGLKEHEQRYVKIFGPVSVILFSLGLVFAYFITVPIGLQFLMGFASDILRPMITVKSYLSFVGTMMLAFGVIFELPLVLIFFTKIGIATPVFLEQKRRHAIVIILIFSAFITPPDVATQLILAIPLIILYEIGIFCSKLMYSKKINSAREEQVSEQDRG